MGFSTDKIVIFAKKKLNSAVSGQLLSTMSRQAVQVQCKEEDQWRVRIITRFFRNYLLINED